MKKTLRHIAIILLVLSLVVVIIYCQNINKFNYGFNRNIKIKPLKIAKIFLLPNGSYYFIGTSELKMFFRDLHNSEAIYGIDTAFNEIQTLRMRTESLKSVKESGRSWFDITDSVIYCVEEKTGKLTIDSRYDSSHAVYDGHKRRLSHCIALSGHRIIGKNTFLRGNEVNRRILKVNFQDGKIENVYMPSKQGDGVFSTDGQLQYSAMHNMIFYMFFYRGEILCLDTNLKELYAIKTIDTITTAKIQMKKTVEVKNGRKITGTHQTGLTKVVNKNFTIHNSKLYVLSALKSASEKGLEFKGLEVIDVYSIPDGKYINSFYVPKYRNRNLREFRLIGNHLYATFGSDLLKFELPAVVF